MSWQTAIPAGGQRRKTNAPAPADRPAGLFTNRHGYTLRRCDCGTAVLPDHDRCVVCAFNADPDEGEDT